MIQRSSLSVRGLYNWDNTLFDNMVLPTGVDKDLLVTNILSELGELEVLYPDSDYMKKIIGYWSQKQLPTWTKLATTLSLEYDPLNSYKKHTVHEGEDSKHTDHSGTDGRNITHEGSDSKHRENAEVKNSTETNKVKAYNEAVNYVDYKQDTITGNDTVDETESNENSFERTDTTNKTFEQTDTGTNAFERTVTGNIGIYPSQRLLSEELDLREKYNIYDMIIKDFKLRFCLLLY